MVLEEQWAFYHSKETGFQLLFYLFFDLQNDLIFHSSKGLLYWRAFRFNPSISW